MKNYVAIIALSFALAACLGGGGGSSDGGGGGTTPTTPGQTQEVPGVGTPGGVSAVPPQS